MSGDLISRQAVLDLLFNSYIKTELTSIGYASKEYAELCVDELNELPSVNPQEPKTGHWKRISMDLYVQHATAYYQCSECGEKVIGEHNYCQFCGARMESE